MRLKVELMHKTTKQTARKLNLQKIIMSKFDRVEKDIRAIFENKNSFSLFSMTAWAKSWFWHGWYFQMTESNPCLVSWSAHCALMEKIFLLFLTKDFYYGVRMNSSYNSDMSSDTWKPILTIFIVKSEPVPNGACAIIKQQQLYLQFSSHKWLLSEFSMFGSSN